MSHSTIPIIVTYYPSISHLQELFCTLEPNVKKIIWIDNTPDQDLSGSSLAGNKTITYINCPHNVGLAAAQNIGIDLAIKSNAKHILLLDQDSMPALDMLPQLEQAIKYIQSNNTKVNVAAVGPQLIDRQTRSKSGFHSLNFAKPHKHCSEAESIIESGFIIASGSLIPIEALNEIGLMNHHYFIDHIDTEWAFRAQKKGFKVYGVCDAHLEHSIGERRLKIWLGRWRELPIHKPFRYFYIFRNTLWLAKSPYQARLWGLKNTLRNFIVLSFVVMMGQEKKDTLLQALKGLKAGLLEVDKG